MRIFHKIEKITRPAHKTESNIEKASNHLHIYENIILSPFSHTVEEEIDGDNCNYVISFQVNNAFKKANSHAGEIEMLHTYAPMDEYEKEGMFPY